MPGRFQKQARTLDCEVIKEMMIDGKIRSSQVSSGKFLPPGASEESTRKVPKASAYVVGSVGVDVGVRYCDCASMDVNPATLPKEEGAHIWSVQGRFFRRGRRKKVPGKGSAPTEDSMEIG
mgnify:CR=1 FL=1